MKKYIDMKIGVVLTMGIRSLRKIDGIHNYGPNGNFVIQISRKGMNMENFYYESKDIRDEIYEEIKFALLQVK